MRILTRKLDSDKMKSNRSKAKATKRELRSNFQAGFAAEKAESRNE